MKEMKGIENEYIVDPNVAKPDDEGIYSNEAGMMSILYPEQCLCAG